MRIEYEILKKAVFGIVDSFEENGSIVLRRFTKKQIAFFDETENYIHKSRKGKSSSCMNIDFYTDSVSLKIDFDCIVASSQPPCYADLYIDGVLINHFGYNAKENREFTLHADMGKGMKRVTVWLPCLFDAHIKEFCLDDGAEFRPAKKDTNILFLGDSITQGYTTVFPSLTYSNVYARERNANCVNQGIGAALFDKENLDPELPFSPDKVFVAYGTNDWTHSDERDFEFYANEYIEKICEIYPDIPKYVILPIWRGNLEEKGKNAVMSFSEMRTLLAKICERYDVSVIDGMKLVPNCPDFFMPDQTHPNEMGAMHYGYNLLKEVQK